MKSIHEAGMSIAYKNKKLMKPIILGAAAVTAIIGYFFMQKRKSNINALPAMPTEPKPVQHHITDAFTNAKQHALGE